MKKETKKLIAAGIVMILGCAACGSVGAATTYGVKATSGEEVNANTIYTDGKIDGFTDGLHAEGNKTNKVEGKISFTTKNINITNTTVGAYAKNWGNIVVGDSNTEKVFIDGKNKVIQALSGGQVAINGKDVTIASTGMTLYIDNAYSKMTRDAQLIVKGSQINIVANSAATAKAIEIKANDGASGAKLVLGTDETDSLVIESEGTGATGVTAGKNSRVEGIAKNIVINADAKTLAAKGIESKLTSQVILKATDILKVEAHGETTGTGIYSSSAQGIELSGNRILVNAEGSKGAVSGMTAETSGAKIHLVGTDVSINSTNKGTNDTDTAASIYSYNTGNVTVDADTISVSANGAAGKTYGVFNDYGSTVKLGKDANSTVEINSRNKSGEAVAIGAAETYLGNGESPMDPASGEVTVTGNHITVRAEGKKTIGINSQEKSKVSVGSKDADIKIYSQGTDDAVGVEAMDGGRVDLVGQNASIAAEGQGDTVGIFVQNSTTDATDNRATVNVNTENTDITAKTALSVFSQGVLNVNSNLVTHGENAIMTRGDSDVNINTDGKHTTKLNGDIVFDYGGTTGVDSNVNVNLTGADSSWTGNAKVNWESSDPSTAPSEEQKQVNNMNLTVADGAQWNPTSVEEKATDTNGTMATAINSLNLNKGVVNLDDKNLSEDFVVNVDKISGNGTINTNNLQNVMAVQDKTDGTKLIVHGTGAIADEILADQTGEKMKLLAATVVTGDEDNERAASDVITTDEGIISGALYADVDSNGNIVENSIERAINTSNQAISNMATLSLMTWRQENNDMNKRLGELRASQGEHGVWARMARGQAKYGAQGIKNQYNYYQLGYDSKISDTWTLGGAFTYTDGESSYTNGSGTNKHTGFAIYGSNLRDDGSFIDIIAKYAHMKNDFDVNGGVGKGDYSTNGYSLSAEYGKRFKQDGFWIEPQAELTYGKVSSADFKTANGATVHQDSMDSLVGRLGFSLGKDLSKGNVYVRASYLYDFQGDASITMMKDGAATPFRTDIGGSWWEFGVGTNLNLGKDTHFYLDVETTAGGDVDTPWQWNAGVRFSF